MLHIAPPPEGWKPPFIPFREARIIDGEPIVWDTAACGAAAILFTPLQIPIKQSTKNKSQTHKSTQRVLLASKLSPQLLLSKETGLWTIKSVQKAMDYSMPIETFIEKNRERPWGKRTEYGFKLVLFAPLHQSIGLNSLRRAFKGKYLNVRTCLFNEKALRNKIKNRITQLAPLPHPSTSIRLLSKSQVLADGLIDFVLIQHLPTLRALVAKRACVISRGKVCLWDLDQKSQAAILGELVWWVHYEPYRAQMAQAARMEDTEMHDPKTRAIKQKLKRQNVPEPCIVEAAELHKKIRLMRDKADKRAAEMSAKLLPKCLLKANDAFNNKQRLELSGTLKRANATITRELVQELAGSDQHRVAEFYECVKWDNKRYSQPPVPSCDKKAQLGECPFAGNTAICAADIKKRSGGADIEDLGTDILSALRLAKTFATPADAIAYGIELGAAPKQ